MWWEVASPGVKWLFPMVHTVLENSLKVFEFCFWNLMPLKMLENRIRPWKYLKSPCILSCSAWKRVFCYMLWMNKIVATGCHILKLKCTKFNFGWGSAADPTMGAYSAPPDSIAVFRGLILMEGRGSACHIDFLWSSLYCMPLILVLEKS